MLIYLFISILVVLLIIMSILNIRLKQKNNTIISEFVKMDEKRCFLHQEVNRLNQQIQIMEKTENTSIPKEKNIHNKDFNYAPIFKGKKAIVGNYDIFQLEQTRKMLRAFGLSVDIVTKGDDIYDKIKNKIKYDIIFTNNIYKYGELKGGYPLMKKLKKLEGFNIPIVVHTVSRNQREQFLSQGFDGYLEKPIQPEKMQEVLEKFFMKKGNTNE